MDLLSDKMPRLLLKFCFGLIAAMVLLIAIGPIAGCFGGCMDHYSDGNRAGTVVKFSNKGLAIKSWEGQMNVGGMTQDSEGHMVPNVFEFSVTDSTVVPQIQAAMESGKRVTLHYHQWAVKPVSIETEYVVDSVK